MQGKMKLWAVWGRIKNYCLAIGVDTDKEVGWNETIKDLVE